MEQQNLPQEAPHNAELESLIAQAGQMDGGQVVGAELGALAPVDHAADLAANVITPIGEIIGLVAPHTGNFLTQGAGNIAMRFQAVADKYGWDLSGISSGVPPELMLAVTLLPMMATVKTDLAAHREAAKEAAKKGGQGNAEQAEAAA